MSLSFNLKINIDWAITSLIFYPKQNFLYRTFNELLKYIIFVEIFNLKVVFELTPMLPIVRRHIQCKSLLILNTFKDVFNINHISYFVYVAPFTIKNKNKDATSAAHQYSETVQILRDAVSSQCRFQSFAKHRQRATAGQFSQQTSRQLHMIRLRRWFAS